MFSHKKKNNKYKNKTAGINNRSSGINRTNEWSFSCSELDSISSSDNSNSRNVLRKLVNVENNQIHNISDKYLVNKV